MTFTGTLHPYQVSDVEVIKDRHQVLVAYGQGTGKTVMSIAAIEDLFDAERITEPGIIVALSSLKYQWSKAIARFTCDTCHGKVEEETEDHTHTPTSTSIVIDGDKKQRAQQYAKAAEWAADYVIVNYEQVVNDWDIVKDLPRGFVIFDEVTWLKGFRSSRSKKAKRLNCAVTLGLTGTPMENGKPEEIFSIMEAIDRDVFGRWDFFDRAFIVRGDFGEVERYRNIPTFQKRLGAAMVRRRADDPEVAPYMPDVVTEEPMLVRLDRSSRVLYDTIAKELLVDLEQAQSMYGGSFSLAALYGQGSSQASDMENRLRGQIMSKVLALQFVCDDPRLIRVSAEKFTDEAADGGSAYAADLVDRGLLDKVTAHPKLDAAKRWLIDILETDPANKVVLFTCYTTMLDLLGETIGDGWVEFSGRLNAKQREANKVRFQTDPDVRVLCSSDAGGYGVDLPQANYLLNYDLPSRAGLADQRDTRIVRASSTFPVVSINTILVRGSIEERDHHRLAQKRATAAAFIDGIGVRKRGDIEPDVESLRKFLRESAV